MPEQPQPSPLSEALATVGERWKLAIVAALLEGPQRFGELAAAIGEIAPNILSQRLRQLEHDGLVLARPYSERPQRFLYELTAPGQDLAGVLRFLADWGARHRAGETQRHAVCGTPLEARWWCPTCEMALDDADLASESLFYL